MFTEVMKDSLQWGLMKASHKYFQKTYTMMSEFEIHPGQMHIICLLYEREGMTQKAISDVVHTKPPTVNVSIQRLEKGGYVCRKPDEKDQRLSRVYLTDKGKATNEKIIQIMTDNETILARNFSDSEICLFKRMLNQLDENMDGLSGETEECPERRAMHSRHRDVHRQRHDDRNR